MNGDEAGMKQDAPMKPCIRQIAGWWWGGADENEEGWLVCALESLISALEKLEAKALDNFETRVFVI